jgi:hypothetical protein
MVKTYTTKQNMVKLTIIIEHELTMIRLVMVSLTLINFFIMS